MKILRDFFVFLGMCDPIVPTVHEHLATEFDATWLRYLHEQALADKHSFLATGYRSQLLRLSQEQAFYEQIKGQDDARPL